MRCSPHNRHAKSVLLLEGALGHGNEDGYCGICRFCRSALTKGWRVRRSGVSIMHGSIGLHGLGITTSMPGKQSSLLGGCGAACLPIANWVDGQWLYLGLHVEVS